MTENQFHVTVHVPRDYPQEYKERRLKDARRMLGENLANEIYYGRWYAIRFREDWPPTYQQLYPGNDVQEYHVSVELHAVETRPFEFDVLDYTSLEPLPLALTAVQEIKRRATNKIKGLVRKWKS